MTTQPKHSGAIDLIGALLVDLDGVLVDSDASIRAAWRWWAEGHGLDPAAVHAAQHGRRSDEVIALIAPGLDVAVESSRVEDRQAERTEGVVPVPGAQELLAAAASRGVPLAIVTSCTPRLAASRLRAGGLVAPAVVVTADDVSVGKPDPSGYLLAAARLGVLPGDCVVLEDAPAGIAAGRAAGARVIGVVTSHAAEDLVGADELVPDLRPVVERLTAEEWS